MPLPTKRRRAFISVMGVASSLNFSAPSASLTSPSNCGCESVPVTRTLPCVGPSAHSTAGERIGRSERSASSSASERSICSDDAPSRSLLVLVAFLVAAASLLLQGSTLPRLVRALGPARVEAGADEERARLAALLAEASGRPALPLDRQQSDERKATLLTAIAAQRQALLDARDDGLFSAEALTAALAVLDADQISLELKGGPA